MKKCLVNEIEHEVTGFNYYIKYMPNFTYKFIIFMNHQIIRVEAMVDAD